MASTTFIDGATTIMASWLNDVNTAVYNAASGISGASTRTAVSKFADIISTKDFGAVGDGVTDDTTALQNWLNAGAGQKICIPKPSVGYKVTAPLTVGDNTTIFGAEGAKIVTADPTISILSATSKSGIVVEGITFQYTTVGSTGLVGAIKFDTCTNCKAINNNFVDASWSGVFLTNSTSCEVRGNYFSGTAGSHQDSNDIAVYNNSNRNLVAGNFCYTANSYGVFHQGPGTTVPQHNTITNNDVAGKAACGIVAYQVTAADTFTQIIGNKVRNIAGSVNGGTTGPGIYIQSAGGSIVTGNEVQNTCTATSSTVNLPAGISVAFDTATGPTLSVCVVSQNRVTTAHYSGIAVASAKVILTDNYAQTTDTTAGQSILVQDCSSSTITGNRITLPAASPRSGLYIFAATASQDGLLISNNVISGGDGVLLNIVAAAGKTIQCNVNGNVITAAGASSQGFSATNLQKSTITGNYIFGSAVGLYLTSCVDIRGANNIVRVTSANRFLSAGSCSNVFFDLTNDFDPSDTAKIQNQAAGCNIEQRTNSSPPGGNWQAGDRIAQSSPAVGQPKGWLCTVAGAPGTWVSEGNL